MTLTYGYATTEDVKSIYRIGDNDDDSALEVAIEAASRSIDGYCNRRFFLDASATARTYLFPYTYAGGRVDVDDFDPATVPVIKSDDSGTGVYSTTWTGGTDYQLEPLNYSNVESGAQWGIRLLGTRYLRVSVFGRPQLQVTAKWGWPAVPTAIKKATQLLAVDLFKAKDAPFGIGGVADFGVFRVRDNAIVTGLLAPYRMPKGLA